MEALAPLVAQAAPHVAAYDAFVKDLVFKAVGSVGWQLEPHNAMTIDLPLVRSPTPVVTAIVGYLTIVGCAVLKNAVAPAKSVAPPSFLFKGYMLFHNFFLSALSLYMCVTCIKEAVAGKYSVWGNGVTEGQTSMAKVLWLFYVSKLYEFFDTFIMIAKGSYRQVSVLHVYHHGSIAFIWWAIVYRAPGGDAYFSAAMNRSVCGEAPEHCARVWVRFVRIFAKPPTAVQHQRRVRIHRPRTITKMTSIYPTPRIWGLLNLFRGLLCLTAPRDPPNTLVTYLTQRVRPCPLPPNDPAPAGCTL